MPSDTQSWTADESCGVFVSATGSDDGDGTPDAPVSTLAEAIELAAKNEDEAARRVYACAGTFNEAVTVAAGVTIYGGLDCEANWQWDGVRKTTLTTSPGVVPLTMRTADVHIEDVHVIAPAIAPESLGKSSIAAIVDDSRVTLVRSIFEAGDAAPGAQGASPPPQREQVEQGSHGKAACSASVVITENTRINDCGTADTSDDSRGGRGGNGFEDRGGAALSGSPGDDANPNGGTYNAATGTCSNGQAGRDGDPGEPGAGARGIGQISSTGYAGEPGRDGENGKTAQGGGGGAGSRGHASCPDSEDGGASGGNGGAGGCGGAGGKGGSPGGSSIALLSLNAQLTFRDVRLIAGNGGKGGDGTVGQIGGLGGYGGRGGMGFGDNALPGCNGGMGGQGGTGGRGGGGQGGHSLGIAFLGTPDTLPSLEGATFRLGAPGLGGAGNTSEQNGDPGQASQMLDFSQPQRAPAP
ncbi:hypothetical protein [Sorangium sp. So ce513]|uniref:hypothetical protein n=1 Tax=Sorangium sp. So ce513 TaxID=3133315 RepID=UPI003F6167AF